MNLSGNIIVMVHLWTQNLMRANPKKKCLFWEDLHILCTMSVYVTKFCFSSIFPLLSSPPAASAASLDTENDVEFKGNRTKQVCMKNTPDCKVCQENWRMSFVETDSKNLLKILKRMPTWELNFSRGALSAGDGADACLDLRWIQSLWVAQPIFEQWIIHGYLIPIICWKVTWVRCIECKAGECCWFCQSGNKIIHLLGCPLIVWMGCRENLINY